MLRCSSCGDHTEYKAYIERSAKTVIKYICLTCLGKSNEKVVKITKNGEIQKINHKERDK